MANLLKFAAVALPIIGGGIGLAADYFSDKNRTEEAKEAAREAAREEVQRIYNAEYEQMNEEA